MGYVKASAPHLAKRVGVISLLKKSRTPNFLLLGEKKHAEEKIY